MIKHCFRAIFIATVVSSFSFTAHGEVVDSSAHGFTIQFSRTIEAPVDSVMQQQIGAMQSYVEAL